YQAGKKRMARGNSLFTATGGGFRDTSIESGITSGGWAWSSGFADLNNDGWQDLVVANGYLSNTRDDDL
ncbi:VCBS repeat-containing protein, partial [bacterium]|nr:VCBS repeat-containing protein [bacterium]